MNSTSIRTLHVINLEGRGGMEHLFLSYIGSTPNAQPDRTSVATKDDVHADLRPKLRASPVSRHNLKRWRRIRLPAIQFLRSANLERILARERPDQVVLWSTLPAQKWVDAFHRHGASIVYYDHGKAWQVTPSQGRRALANIDRAITVSHAGRRLLQERHAFTGPVEVVPNGLRFPQLPDRPEDRPLGGPLQIGFGGRLVDHKGVPIVLAAAAELAGRGIDFHLQIAGAGPEQASLQQLAMHQGLDNHVTFHGNRQDMEIFYRSVDIVAMPSLREPFGLAAIEAAALGAVPLVARIDGLAETVCHEETGLALPVTGSLEQYRQLGGLATGLPEQVYDPDGNTLRAPGIVEPGLLADTIARLAVDPQELRRLSVNAAEFARARFSNEQFVTTLDRALG